MDPYTTPFAEKARILDAVDVELGAAKGDVDLVPMPIASDLEGRRQLMFQAQ